MRSTILKTTLSIATAALLTVSCTKEIAQKSYPSEITLDNWEAFVDAPEELLQQLKANQPVEAVKPYAPKSIPPAIKIDEKDKAFCHHGKVTSWNGSYWSGLGFVQIDYLHITTYSADPSGKYGLVNLGNHPICMTYPGSTGIGGGLNIFDVVMTQRHILGIQTFEQLDIDQAPRRYVAADVVDDGVINSLDIDKMVAIILGTNTAPTLDIAYVSTSQLKLSVVTDPAQLSGGIKDNCNTPPNLTIRAIKMGDVTGDNIL